jgi:hypothetical protein
MSKPEQNLVSMSAGRWRVRLTALGVVAVAAGLGALTVWMTLRKDIRLIDSKDALRPGLGARGAYSNSGSRDAGPDVDNPHPAART